jgi:hypothetical protein
MSTSEGSSSLIKEQKLAVGLARNQIPTSVTQCSLYMRVENSPDPLDSRRFAIRA